jgi:MoaA/NifB/PqqE/SkfB family radical SAM enzyme
MSSPLESLSERLIASAKKNKVPLSGGFELTGRCNLKCKMCYVCKDSNDKSAMKAERTAKEWIRLAEEARDAGTLFLLLTGGEVFLREDFKAIYEEICMMGLNTQIYTNATMITPKIASWIGRIPPSSMEVTLYGASPETYYKVCGDASGYERAVRGIDLLLKEGINLKVRTTVIKDNSEDFFKIAELADSRNIELSLVNYVSPRRDCCSSQVDSMRLSPHESVQYESRINKYYKVKNEQLEVSPSNNTQTDHDAVSTGERVINYKNIDNPFECSAGNYSFWVTWDGKMTPCGLMDNPSVEPFNKSFANSWNKLQEDCKCVPVCDECRVCEYKDYCMTCPARLKTETGTFNQKAPYLCSKAKKLKEFLYST